MSAAREDHYDHHDTMERFRAACEEGSAELFSVWDSIDASCLSEQDPCGLVFICDVVGQMSKKDEGPKAAGVIRALYEHLEQSGEML